MALVGPTSFRFPGLYAVSFSLPGFNSVKREGIELTTGFTASVNVELKIGSVAETVVVSGQTPIVDVTNVKRQVVMTRDVVDALPTGKSYTEMATLIPGIQLQNGAQGSATGMGGSGLGMDNFPTLTAHGARTTDTRIELGGMALNIFASRQDGPLGQLSGWYRPGIRVRVSRAVRQSESGGVRVSITPKEGGNRHSGFLFANFANGSLLADNMTDALRATGLRDPDRTRRCGRSTRPAAVQSSATSCGFTQDTRASSMKNTRPACITPRTSPRGVRRSISVGRPR